MCVVVVAASATGDADVVAEVVCNLCCTLPTVAAAGRTEAYERSSIESVADVD